MSLLAMQVLSSKVKVRWDVSHYPNNVKLYEWVLFGSNNTIRIQMMIIFMYKMNGEW